MSRRTRATRGGGLGRPLQPRFPKEPHHRRAADDSLAAKKPQASNVIRLELERVKRGERARALVSTSALLIISAKSRRQEAVLAPPFSKCDSANVHLLLCRLCSQMGLGALRLYGWDSLSINTHDGVEERHKRSTLPTAGGGQQRSMRFAPA
jgi:hypothetical protein